MDKKRITRRLKGLGFYQEDESYWEREDAPKDRAWHPYENYGWWRGRLAVLLQEDQFFLARLTWSFDRTRRSKNRTELQKTKIGTYQTLSELVYAIEQELLGQRVRGKMKDWWYQHK